MSGRPANVFSILFIARLFLVVRFVSSSLRLPVNTQTQRCARSAPLRIGVMPALDAMPQSQVLDQFAVARNVRAPQIIEHAPALAHHHEQATPAVMILLVGAEMVGQFVDARCQQRDLHGCAAAVVLVQLVLLDDCFLVEPHGAASSRVVR
jgi:hypothetical protein